MSGSRCLFSAGSALRSVFVPATVTSRTSRATSSQLQRLLVPALHCRTLKYSRRGQFGPKPAEKPTVEVKRMPRNDDLVHETVYLRGADNKLSVARPASSILAELDPATHTLLAIHVPRKRDDAPSLSSSSSSSSSGELPICIVVTKEEERAWDRERGRAAREQAAKAAEDEAARSERGKKTKELEINWSIDPHDLGIKLKLLRGFLAKGLRVNVLCLSKARQGKRRASREEAEEVLRLLRATAKEVEGTREYKPATGELGFQLRMFLDGPAKGSGGGVAGDSGDGKGAVKSRGLS